MVLNQDCITHSIVGATKKSHVDDILKTTSFKLSNLESEVITKYAIKLREEMYVKYFLPIKLLFSNL